MVVSILLVTTFVHEKVLFEKKNHGNSPLIDWLIAEQVHDTKFVKIKK